MHNGRVYAEGEIPPSALEHLEADGETVPWCPECEHFAVPTDAGECGDCGTAVEYREADIHAP